MTQKPELSVPNPPRPLNILAIEDSPYDAELLLQEMRRAGMNVRMDVAKTAVEVVAFLLSGSYDLVLSDFGLRGWTGLDALQLLRERQPDLPFILVSGSLGDEKAAECIKLGAADFVLKDRLNRLPHAITRALGEKALREHQHAAEEALRRSEENLRSLVENAPYAIYKTNVDRGCFVSANPALLAMLGYASEAEVLALDLTTQVYGDPRSRPRLLPELQRHERFSDVELEWKRKDGRPLLLRSSGRLMQGANGERFFEAIAEDITERKQAEAALRESEARLRLSVQAAHIGLWDWDVQTNEVYYSPEWKSQIGYADHEITNRFAEWERLLHPDDLEPAQKRLRAFLADPRGGYEFEFRLRHKDGSYRWIYTQADAVRDAGGKPLRVLGCHMDITERRELEQQFRQAQKMEAVGRLAGGIAHDFNNLLTVIRGYAELMLEEPDREKARRHAHNIIRASDRTAALTRQLLAFSRKQVLWPQVLDLNAVLAETQKMLPPLLGEDVRVLVFPGPKLGRVKADPGQIEQVLMNLAINARDAMPKGGKLVLETSNVECDEGYCATHPGARPGSYVMLAVSDNGCGMDQETQSHIFEPFFTTKAKDKGTGLGLATAYGIVKQSGGHIWVYSEPGIGTTFKVYLPRVDEKAASTPPPPRFEEKAAVTETILAVEDEEGVRRLTRMFLEQRGYRVLEASNGAQALEVATAHAGPIHLLLTDMVMPGMRGHELAEQLCSSRPQMKVLYVSGYTDGSIVQNGELAAGSAFLEKPFSSDALARKVRQVLNANASESSHPAAPGTDQPVEKEAQTRP